MSNHRRKAPKLRRERAILFSGAAPLRPISTPLALSKIGRAVPKTIFAAEPVDRTDFFVYINSTTWIQASPNIMDTGDAALPNLRDAVDECQHGRLHGDRTPACGCWPTERNSK